MRSFILVMIAATPVILYNLYFLFFSEKAYSSNQAFVSGIIGIIGDGKFAGQHKFTREVNL